MKHIYLLIAIWLLSSCQNQRKEDKVANPTETVGLTDSLTIYSIEFNEIMNGLSIVYDSAISNCLKGQEKNKIVFKYKSTVDSIYDKTQIVVEKMNTFFINNPARQKESDAYFESLDNNEVSKKAKRLKECGVVI